MRIAKSIPPSVLDGVSAVLSAYVPDVTPDKLRSAIKAFHQEAQPESITAGQLLTVKEACSRLRCSRATLYRMFSSGSVRRVRIGARGTRVPESDINAIIQSGGASNAPQ